MPQIQIPAEGILQRNDWGDAKVYQVVCTCGQDWHDHNVWVEADETGEINCTIYATVKTNWWSKTRWHHIWQLLTKGYIDTETVVTMTKQQTINYANTLLSAVDDVEKFSNRSKNIPSSKFAEMADCV